MTRDRSPSLLFILLLLLLSLTTGILVLPRSGQAAGLVDVPVRPWTYFEVNRDWMYTAIEKLVNAGLVGPWVLNTKPMSRMEVARVVAVALRKIRQDEIGRFSRRTDLEPVLYDLMEELAPELEAMAIRTGTDEFAGQPWFTVQPISKLQARAYGVRRDAALENSQGLRLAEHFNGTVGLASHFQFGDFLSGYLHPEFRAAENEQDTRIVEGYLKLKLGNVALRFGRESIWWGPGYHGTMLFGNNAAPLDQIKIGTAEPIIFPWIFKYLGPTRMELLYARLEEARDFPNALLAAWRIDMAPFPFLELGAARVVQFGGEGRPSLSPLDYLAVLFVTSDDPDSRFNTNQIYSLDATIRLHDVDRVFPLSRDLTLYAELGVDDTCCENVIWPLKPAYLVGLYLPNLFGRDDTEFRVEWAATTAFSFTHGIYTSGYAFEGFPLAHYIGTRGQELYIRTTRRLRPSLQLGSELGLAKVGPTQFGQENLPREERKYVGVDVTFQPTKALSMLLGYRYERVENKGFVEGQSADNHLVRFEATYSFPAWERGMLGRQRRAEALRPVTPPPAPRAKEPPGIDPDEVVSVDFVKRLFQDAGTIVTSPLRWDTRDWLILAGVGLTTGGLMFADHGIRNYVQDNRSETKDTLSDIFEPFGTVVPPVLIAGLYGTGVAFDIPKLRAAAADATEAGLITSGMVLPMKWVTGRSRPDADEGTTDYDSFRLGTSLPSFNTALAFSVASALTEHFDHPVISALAYGLAGAVGLTRIYEDRHWTSDVFLGAAIGTVVGKAVVKLNENRRAGSRVSVVPLLGDGIQGAALKIDF